MGNHLLQVDVMPLTSLAKHQYVVDHAHTSSLALQDVGRFASGSTLMQELYQKGAVMFEVSYESNVLLKLLRETNLKAQQAPNLESTLATPRSARTWSTVANAWCSRSTV